ncbi:MAG: hypothetical protein Q8L66_02205 [Caulobacter sp.]|nr:hypothetical protein [Caulobacter sp.]
MTNRLDSLLRQLREQDLDRDLSAVELGVYRHIALERSARASMVPARLVAVGIALILGTGVGGLTAASTVDAPRTSIFAAADALAPSTLLDGPR